MHRARPWHRPKLTLPPLQLTASCASPRFASLGVQVRGTISGALVDKSLKLGKPVTSKDTTTTTTTATTTTTKTKSKSNPNFNFGTILNLLQTDASALENTALQFHTIWDGPLQICIYISLLLHFLGKSVLLGLSVLLLTIPVNFFTLRTLNKLRKEELASKDARTRLINEAIANMKTLKLHGWEESFAAEIQKVRKEELKRHKKAGLLKALNSAVLGGGERAL